MCGDTQLSVCVMLSIGTTHIIISIPVLSVACLQKQIIKYFKIEASINLFEFGPDNN